MTPETPPVGPKLPRLAVAAWAVALVVIAVLGWAVASYLSSDSGMQGHSHSAGDALYRAGDGPLGPLFGTALFTAWHLDAVAVAVLVVLAAWYLTGVALVPVRHPGMRWPWPRTALFIGGLAVCAFATNGSIAVYDQALFTAHMAGHLALVMVAPALLVAGRPLRLSLVASRESTRARIERIAGGRIVSFLTAPPVALASYAAVIVGSHLTGVMDTVMNTTWAGQVEHVVYLVAGCQFFVLIVGAEPIRWQLSSPARWLLLAVAMAVDTFTGIVLLQGTRAVDMLPAPDLTVNALTDTRTGGAIMWVGGDAIMAAIMIVLVLDWLRTAGEVSEGSGWLEQARRATFAQHTGSSTPDGTQDEFDEDDAARASYNEWLASLDRKS
ncbi:MAG TPA: cytochrome c oxidase assembly protein [Jatrophihabitantaceae bacterium]|nr:cytochrome c oxidase assembly protein [Jatrophihabitantaceae bacterium]